MIDRLNLAPVLELKLFIDVVKSSPILVLFFTIYLNITIINCILLLLVFHLHVLLDIRGADGVLRGDLGHDIVTLVLFLSLDDFILVLYFILIIVAIL